MTIKWNIPGLSKMTKQEIFDMSARHILSTGKKSYDIVSKGCVYSGSGCAASPFIRQQYLDEADEIGLWELLVNSNKVSKHHIDFIGQLQETHDEIREPDCRFMSAWKENMKLLATRHHLSDAVLNG